MDELTADLNAVLEQARMLHGEPFPRVVTAGNPVLAEIDLPIPGWPLGIWAVGADGLPGDAFDDPAEAAAALGDADLRMAWLAETGHLVWFATAVATADLMAIVTDTPRSFRGCVCERADVGVGVWERLVLRLPMLAACPVSFDAWNVSTPRGDHRGGPGLLADPVTRALDDTLAEQIRRVTDPREGRAEQTWFAWAGGNDEYRVTGVFAATATEKSYPVGAAIPADAIRHFLFLSSLGTWLTYTSHGDSSTIREFDTVRDLYRFQIAGRPDTDVFVQMWKNLAARHPIAHDAELNPLSRWSQPDDVALAPDAPPVAP